MSRTNLAADSESTRSLTSSAKILASAHSCARRAQVALEGMEGISSLLPLAAAGVGVVDSYLTGLIVERSDGRPSSACADAIAVRPA
jgi:hypothetical protein